MTVDKMHQTVERHEPSYFLGEFIARDTRTLRYERVAMPLTSDGKTVSSILAALQCMLVVTSCPSPNCEHLPDYTSSRI